MPQVLRRRNVVSEVSEWARHPTQGRDILGELRLMESDDEPLVRSTESRNVVPRISSLEDMVATEASERRRSDVHSFAHEGVPSTVPAESIPTWVDRDADECSVSSESCWSEQEDLIGEEIPEWGVLPCLAPVVRPVEDCNTRAVVHHRLPSRLLVLVAEPESLQPMNLLIAAVLAKTVGVGMSFHLHLDTESVASCRLSNGDEEVEHARGGHKRQRMCTPSIAVDVESGGTQCAGSRGVG